MSKSGIFSTSKLVAAAAAGLLLTVTACSSQGGAQSAPAAPGAAGGKQYTIAVITHEGPGETFFDRIRAGAEQAAKQHGVTLKYSNDPDVGKQSTLIENAIDSKVDAIASTMPNPDTIGPELQKAGAAGIPTVAINSGIDSYQKYGAKMFFGSDESLAGQAAGQRLAKEDGGSSGKVLCVVHSAGVQTLETRCAGVKQSFPNTENIQVNGQDLASVQQTLQSKLLQDPSITAIVTLDAGVATAAMQAEQAANSKAKLVTFDLNQDVVQAIKDKKIDFSIDQQPYLQSYEAVDSLWLYLTNGNVLGGGKPVLTGPAFVDSTNIDAVATYAANNTR
ncbi:MAG TPA: substrate-binding domain-containing protein [Pseudonocardia sp.]